MGKWTKRLIVFISTIILIAIFGCASMQDIVTPCVIEKDAADYADVNDMTVFLPYTSLYDAKRVERIVDYQHQVNQAIAARILEDDNMQYGFLKDAMTTHIQSAITFQDTIFNPTGPIGIMFPALAGLGIGAFAIRRPGDKTKEEYDTAVNGGNSNDA